MKLIELHILQSFPVTCLNRDDVGSPKSATFGGSQRARVSSQALKRASRLRAREKSPVGFEGIRSRFLLEPFTEALVGAGMDDAAAAESAKLICEAFSSIDKKNPNQVTTAVFLSPSEIQQVAVAVAEGKEPKQAVKKVDRLDAADIALFGRMIANDATLNVEGAAMFSHALSTHTTANEIDFFSAVDDRKGDAEDAGAGMIGTLEYNSATYYRYVAINLDLLFDAKHLGPIKEQEKRKSILRAFITSVLTAVPGARQNSMNGATLPVEVLGIRKDKGQPLQLINAFEKPIKANGNGYAVNSKAEMLKHHADLKSLWGIETSVESLLTDDKLEGFLTKLLTTDV
ncbi:MAG: type I-E CRISPR-associated protein Cas7/Cse4/CasC [Luteolibacter sp.]|jgi:CRISPR system Cascade subunit CasC|nr:type I-E CRISPR-associated protein Cas7/Cse4/CasC [Luteolibacter sp.]